MRNSTMTAVSFTVEDDLISQSSLSNTRMTAFHGLKPFTKDYPDNRVFESQKVRKIRQKAQQDAYKQLNQQTFNPFEHKLNSGFIPSQMDLYQKEKQRQIQMIKKKEEAALNNNKNYTIVFNQEKKSNNKVFQMAANNMLSEQNPNIQDYYNQKFKKNKGLENIDQQNQPQETVKKDNLVRNQNKSQSIKNRPSTNKGLPATEKVLPVSEPISKESGSWNNKHAQINKNIIQKQHKSEQNIQKQKKSQNLHQQHDKQCSVEDLTSPPLRKPTNNVKPIAKQAANQQKNMKDEKKTLKPPVPKYNQNLKKGNAVKKDNLVKNGSKKKYSEVYQGPDKNLVQQLERELSQCPTITFDDIAELDTAKSLLQQAVLLPRMMPQFFKGIRRATRGILLFGPPGTGKTLLAKAIANNNVFFNVSASSLASKWKGQSQKMVRLLFEMAKFHSPSVIFFDQIDAIASKRSQNEHQSARKVKTQLLVQMDGVGSSQNQVFVLAATNRPWDLDQALRRRLQKRIYIPLPGKKGRQQMFNINLKGLKASQKIVWTKIIEQTKGCSGADICNICRDAAYMPMRRKIQQVGGITKLSQIKESELIDQQVSQMDLLQAAKKIKPSVGQQDLKRYQKWMEEFGSS